MKIESESLHRENKGSIDENVLRVMIAECAYFKAEKRGFVDGNELQDWLEAEQEMSKRCFYWFEEV